MSIIIIFLQIKKNPQVLLLIKSDRGRSLPLPDHRDTSLISRHCRSMTVARRMPARASTAGLRSATVSAGRIAQKP